MPVPLPNQPILEIEDFAGDGLFNSGDVIWVCVQNWLDRARPSYMQRVWGDAEAIVVTRKPTGGLYGIVWVGVGLVASVVPIVGAAVAQRGWGCGVVEP